MTWDERQRKFIEWAEAYDSLLWKVARSFAAGADQDDLHQELLLAMWRAIPAFRGDAKGSTFAYRVAYNCALTWNRKRRPSDVSLEDAPEFATFEDLAHDGLAASSQVRRVPALFGAAGSGLCASNNQDADDAARVEMLYRHIRQLPPVDRTLVLLYLDEVSYREMAEILGLSESNVGVRLNRVKKQLAEQIQEVYRA